MEFHKLISAVSKSTALRRPPRLRELLCQSDAGMQPMGNTNKASLSHEIFLHNGLISPSTNGVYRILPLLQRSLDKLTNLVESRMSAIGAHKLTLPHLTNIKLWERSERLGLVADELFRVRGRCGTDFCLGPTHEEEISALLAGSQPLGRERFPLLWYQITWKFRDEKRPRNGLLRSREFLMKDLYSFDSSRELSESTFARVISAYRGLFDSLGVTAVAATADAASMGGYASTEFHILSPVGEDSVLVCAACGVAHNAEVVRGDESRCRGCGWEGPALRRAIEVGHAFLLGRRYSQLFGSTFREVSGSDSPLDMGCYGLGLTRLLGALAEVNRRDGAVVEWPVAVAPFLVAVLPPKVGSREAGGAPQRCDEVATALNNSGVTADNVVVSDATRRTIGHRLEECRHLGIPYAVIQGSKATGSGLLEVYNLRTDVSEMYSPDEICRLFSPTGTGDDVRPRNLLGQI